MICPTTLNIHNEDGYKGIKGQEWKNTAMHFWLEWKYDEICVVFRFLNIGFIPIASNCCFAGVSRPLSRSLGAGAPEGVAGIGGRPQLLPQGDHSKVEGDVPVAQTYLYRPTL